MAEVTPGIYRLKLPLPPHITLGYINAYLIQGNSGYLLVDTCWDTNEAFDSLERQLVEIDVSVKDISQIVVTHIHPDHYGLVGRIKGLSHAEFALHHLEKDAIESRYITMNDLLQQMAQWLHCNGVPPDELGNLQTASVGLAKYVKPTFPDIVLRGGETISSGDFAFQVLWTPGHSPGHICLYEPTIKILLSGDHILPTISPNVGLHPQSGGNPLGAYIDSLNMLKQLDIELILPGHENPFTGLKTRIDELFQHHNQRNTEILAIMETEPKTAYQIAKGMTWSSDSVGAGWQNLAEWDKRLAVLETIAHLEAMRADCRADRLTKNSIIYYQQT
ncbi:MBL fold metallo-hydrolase [Chloroflexota bacterium]